MNESYGVGMRDRPSDLSWAEPLTRRPGPGTARPTRLCPRLDAPLARPLLGRLPALWLAFISHNSSCSSCFISAFQSSNLLAYFYLVWFLYLLSVL